jgi:hypothetical protein
MMFMWGGQNFINKNKKIINKNLDNNSMEVIMNPLIQANKFR